VGGPDPAINTARTAQTRAPAPPAGPVPTADFEKGTHGADENQITETETELGREPETRFEKRESVEQIAQQEQLEHDETETRFEQSEIESAFHQFTLEITLESVDGQSKKPLDARQDESPGHGGGRDAARGRRRHGRDP
jgi:hypothetical protein